MFTSVTVLALLGTATAHMQVEFPPPLKSKFNPNTPSAEIDYNMVKPLDASGSDFPCKGYQTLLGTPAGASTASFAIGSQANMTITGASEGSSANHGGGSCQISLSTDSAKTFTVLQSIIGNCPTTGTSNLEFAIPADAPAGDHVLAWTWHNQIGNREMYMNCAAVTLTTAGGSSGGGVKKMARAAAYASRPGIFIANVGAAGGGCTTEEMFDVLYPEPGPDVDNTSSKPKTPICGVTQQVSGGGSSVPSPSGGDDGGIFSPDSGAGVGTGSSISASTTNVAPTSSEQPATTFATSMEPCTAHESPAATQPASSASPTQFNAGSAFNTVSTSNAGSSSSSNAASASNTPGSRCAKEGAWACLSNGSSFQRCASGQWSVIMQMAAGTKCLGGTSDQMNIVAVAAQL